MFFIELNCEDYNITSWY